MKILITGSSGLIGSVLTESLSARGHKVGRLIRKEGDKNSPYWNPETGKIDLRNFSEMDAVVNLAGENIFHGRWTAAKKSNIANSRINSTKLLSELLARLDQKPKVMISGSAIGFYGDRGENIVDESSQHGKGFLSDVCRRWEESTIPAMNSGIRVVLIRTGIVLSPDGGILKKMIFPFRLGLGGSLGNGKQYMSWISIKDLVESIQYLINNDTINGPVNLVSPNPSTNSFFTKNLGHILSRPTVFPLPEFVVRIIFGERANELLLASTRVLPAKLIKAGYEFYHPELGGALKYLLKKH